MVNLIGLAIGRSLAQQADVPEDEVARFGLLGAAAPSPLLGAVLVSSALRRGRAGYVAGRRPLLGGGGRIDPDELQRRREHQQEREEQRERDHEEARQREQEERRWAQTRRDTQDALREVAQSVTDMVEEIDSQRTRTFDVEGTWQAVQRAIGRLTEQVETAKQEAEEEEQEGEEQGHRGD
jgi:hypothetical protein